MRRVTIRKSKRNSDFYEVVGGHSGIVRTTSKVEANQIARARRRVVIKRKRRSK